MTDSEIILEHSEEMAEYVEELLRSEKMLNALGEEPAEVIFNVGLSLACMCIANCLDNDTILQMVESCRINTMRSATIAKALIDNNPEEDEVDLEGKTILPTPGEIQ